MISTIPPAILVVPLPNRDQVEEAVNKVIGVARGMGIEVDVIDVETPVFLESAVRKDGEDIVLTRVDVYLSAADGDIFNALPLIEMERDGFREAIGTVHLIKGTALIYFYRRRRGAYTLEKVVLYNVSKKRQ